MKVRVLLRTPFEPITESYYPKKPLGHPLARFPWPQARPFVGSAVSLSGQSGLFIRAWRGFESRTANHRNLGAGEATLPAGSVRRRALLQRRRDVGRIRFRAQHFWAERLSVIVICKLTG